MMHVAVGWMFRDLKVRQGAVVYCALEGASAFRNRAEAFRRENLNGGPAPSDGDAAGARGRPSGFDCVNQGPVRRAGGRCDRHSVRHCQQNC
jgi:hypothetical protein